MFRNVFHPSIPILMPFFQKDGDGGGGADDPNDQNLKAREDSEPKDSGQKSFDEWLETQPTYIRAMYAEHIGNLKSALDKERKANKENAARMKKLDELEAKEAERLEAQKSEIEKALDAQKKAEAERDAALSELNTERRKYAVIAVATRMGFIDPEDAFILANLSEIEYKDGKWYGIEEALKALSESKPHLLGKNGKSGDNLGNDTKNVKKESVKPKVEQMRPVVRF